MSHNWYGTITSPKENFLTSREPTTWSKIKEICSLMHDHLVDRILCFFVLGLISLISAIILTHNNIYRVVIVVSGFCFSGIVFCICPIICSYCPEECPQDEPPAEDYSEVSED